jgi:hypothetical protein
MQLAPPPLQVRSMRSAFAGTGQLGGSTQQVAGGGVAAHTPALPVPRSTLHVRVGPPPGLGHLEPLLHFKALAPVHAPLAFTFTPRFAATLSFQYVRPSQPQTAPSVGEGAAALGVHTPPVVPQLATLQ